MQAQSTTTEREPVVHAIIVVEVQRYTPSADRYQGTATLLREYPQNPFRFDPTDRFKPFNLLTDPALTVSVTAATWDDDFCRLEVRHDCHTQMDYDRTIARLEKAGYEHLAIPA
jgi:hypothetical protein